jgi:putative Holliday junction resolvase
MLIENLDSLKQHLKRDSRLLGLDVGEKTIGLALSDVMRTIATPFVTLTRTKMKADSVKLAEIVAKQNVAALIIGYPINMDGSLGPRAQATRDYADALAKFIELPMLLADERLSTMAVTRAIEEAEMSRNRRDDVVDKMAAAYILQGVLDRLNYQT